MDESRECTGMLVLGGFFVRQIGLELLYLNAFTLLFTCSSIVWCGLMCSV